MPTRPSKPQEYAEFYPEVGDLVNHFHFGECSILSSDGDRIRLRVNQGSVRFEDATGLRLRARAYTFRLEVEAQDSGGLRALDSVRVDKSVTEFLDGLEPSISEQPYDVE